MFGDDNLEFHSYKVAASGYNHLTLGYIFHWLDLGGVTIYLVENHMVVVPFDGSVREFYCLVRENGLSVI